MGSQDEIRTRKDYPEDQTAWIDTGGPRGPNIKRVPAEMREGGPRNDRKLIPLSPYEHYHVIAKGTVSAEKAQQMLDDEIRALNERVKDTLDQ